MTADSIMLRIIWPFFLSVTYHTQMARYSNSKLEIIPEINDDRSEDVRLLAADGS